MIGNLIKAALIAAVLALIVQSLPDIKRYLEHREM
jgi:exosome complex RNA-binding protein Rrp42 (RNase PH superfamily)